MRFEDFAQAHGLIIRHVEYGKWVRVPTEDHVRKKNGAYKHLGDVAFVQNHATMTEPAIWHPENNDEIKIDRAAMAKRKAEADRQLQRDRENACRKATGILNQTVLEQHAYLDSKGFPKMKGLVYYQDEETNLLVVPMHEWRQLTPGGTTGGRLVGCQLIDVTGEKKFLKGQQTAGAQHIIGTIGKTIWCEGYATALSIHACAQAAKIPCRIHVCFSAGNMKALAKGGYVIADNDRSRTGEEAAKAIGLPYWMAEQEGFDFNDWHKEIGTLKASMTLRRFLIGG